MSETTRTTKSQSVPEGARRCEGSRGLQWGTLTLSLESLLVWSKRMLEALERGNEQCKWHTLADKVWSPKTLEIVLEYPDAWFAERGLISLKTITHRTAESPGT